MRFIIYLVFIALFVWCIIRIRKMIKNSQELDLQEGRKPVNGWFVTSIFAVGALLTCIFLWFILSAGSPDLGYKHNIEKYTFNNHVLSFDLPQYRATYEVSLPLYVDIKPNDVVDVRYFVDKGRLKNITGVFVNGKAVHDGSYQLTYKEITTHR